MCVRETECVNMCQMKKEREFVSKKERESVKERERERENKLSHMNDRTSKRFACVWVCENMICVSML